MKSEKTILQKKRLHSTDKQVLESFCEYVVGANPDFAYSETYLKKCIDDYCEFQSYVTKLLDFSQKNIVTIINKIDNSQVVKMRLDEIIVYEKENNDFSLQILDNFGIKSKTRKHRLELYFKERKQIVETIDFAYNIDKPCRDDIESVKAKIKEVIKEVNGQ